MPMSSGRKKYFSFSKNAKFQFWSTKIRLDRLVTCRSKWQWTIGISSPPENLQEVITYQHHKFKKTSVCSYYHQHQDNHHPSQNHDHYCHWLVVWQVSILHCKLTSRKQRRKLSSEHFHISPACSLLDDHFLMMMMMILIIGMMMIINTENQKQRRKL